VDRHGVQGDVFGNIGHSERGAIEEAQCAHDLVDGLRLQATRPEMQSVFADILESELVRRAPEVATEVLNGADVDSLCPRRHVADGHVVDHALSKR
jgi:hypothetical protein